MHTDVQLYDEKKVLPVGCRSILHNPETYPDPEVFRPERFLEDGCKDYSDFAFGYGRRSVPFLLCHYQRVAGMLMTSSFRVCPGRWFATEAVWAAVVSILASFEIVPSLDEHGKPKPVTVDCTTGAIAFVSFPLSSTAYKGLIAAWIQNACSFRFRLTCQDGGHERVDCRIVISTSSLSAREGCAVGDRREDIAVVKC